MAKKLSAQERQRRISLGQKRAWQRRKSGENKVRFTVITLDLDTYSRGAEYIEAESALQAVQLSCYHGVEGHCVVAAVAGFIDVLAPANVDNDGNVIGMRKI